MKKKTRIGRILLLCFAAIVIAAAAFLVIKLVPFGSYDLQPEAGTTLANGQFSYDLPLDKASPWPKFRANALQNGRTPVEPKADAIVQPWEYHTAKGIFSSPVIDAEGTAYIGSADKFFYAIKQDGTVKWKVETGEIIDSSALLDDEGRVIFGSGDAKVYCCDRETGAVLWTQQAATAAEVSKEFGIDTYNVNWYEGNMGILPDGTILAPNDNYLLHRLNRGTGEVVQRYLANEMIWSLPSYNQKTGNLFFGTIYSVSNNVMSYDAESGNSRWKTGGIGATAATTMLTSYKEKGGVIVGSYDGTLRCLAQDNGKTLWKQALRDHIYASPAQLSDGTVIQAAADGTVYALDPSTGDLKWAFDTLEPIRSSPAVDAADQIYFGSGEGKLFCVNSDGTLRWSYQCIREGRNDLNGSPALGYDGVYIAGESGTIFFVPYDFPLRPENAKNARCATSQNLPGNGGHLLYTAPLGSLTDPLPREIDANQSLTFTLVAREDGNTVIGQLDPKSLDVSIAGNEGFSVQISADKRFLILIPQEYWVPDAKGDVEVKITGAYKINPSRAGMLFFGGKKGGDLNETFRFGIQQRDASENPFVYPTAEGKPASLIELRRQSIPNPGMLPSLNQIGFDSLHYLASAVDEIDGQTLFWVVGGKKLPDGKVVPDPASDVRFPLMMAYKDGLATFTNYEGFTINFVGSWEMPIASYRIAAAYDPESKLFDPVPTYNVTANCDEIQFYGPGLKLMGMSELKGGCMYTSGSLELEELEPIAAPQIQGTVSVGFEGTVLKAEISGSGLKADEHAFGLLVTCPEDNAVIPLPYAYGTSVQAGNDGTVASVTLDMGKNIPLEEGKTYQVYFMVDAYPADVLTVNY